ncbi:MAG TPA: ricin-type beta-trefoil lectin domain protein [Patescibacteria group bacterium]|nr:ricin-type beta-trefoil lectin domain protein [Patescibacteria group bacterium]
MQSSSDNPTDADTPVASPKKMSSLSQFFKRNSKLAVFVVSFAVVGGIIALYVTHAATVPAPINSAFNGKCLDLQADRHVNEAKIQLYKCNNSTAQKWTIRENGTIHANNTDNWCLDVKSGKRVAGTLVQLYECNGTAAQIWKLGANNAIVNPQSGRCLDVQYSGQADGTQIWIWDCNATNAQKWHPQQGSTPPVTPTPTPVPTPPTPSPTPTPTPTPPTSGLQRPTWSDEFNGNSLSYATDNGGGTWRTKGYEAGGSLNNGYGDFVAENWNATQSQLQQYGLANVANGVLSMKAMRNPGIPGVGNKWVGPYLVSNNVTNLTWRYGYFEWRMRNPNPVRGMFPTLWLFNNIADKHNGYEGAELDMIEIFGSRTGSPWYAGVHFNPNRSVGGVNKEGQNVATLNTDTSNWHRYSIEWTADKITYARDGATIGTLTGNDAAWYRNADLGIRMNYTMDPKFVGAGSPNHSTDNDPAIGTMPTSEVDYVRYYKTKPVNLPGGTNDPY